MGHIATIEGRPVLMHNGQVVPRAAYIDRILRGDWEERIKDFVESGVTCYGITAPHGKNDYFDSVFWSDEGEYPQNEDGYAFALKVQAETILRLCPEAVLFVVCASSVPKAWMEKHPDHMQTDENGTTYREASLCSAPYLEGVATCLRGMVQYCEAQPWGERVFGYYVYPFGEGGMPLCHSGYMFDCSAVNEAAFRDWLTAKYADDATLQDAWGCSNVSLETACVPRDTEVKARRQAGPATFEGEPVEGKQTTNCGVNYAGHYHWIEAANFAVERDYVWFMRDNFLRWIRTMNETLKGVAQELGVERVVGFDITKQPLMGWQIQLSFDGIGDGQSFPNNYYFSGSFGVGELLDELDIIVTPADYHARTLGYAYEAEGVSDSMIMRGRVMVVENDARCYVGQGVNDQGAFRDDTECRAGLLRNAALMLSRGLHDYWCNIGSSYYHAAGIQEHAIADITRLLDGMNDHPHRETGDAIAFVIDDESPLYEDFTSGYQSLAVIWQRIRGLAHCGIPYRIYLLSDLAHEAMPDYKVWVFPNLFKVDEAVQALLERKVLKDGNMAIFGPATGITDGRYLTAEPASRLLGVPMELHRRSTQRQVVVQDIPGHPITRELSAGHIFGDSLPYGPTLTPCERAVEETEGATRLGHGTFCWFIHRTGMFIKETSEAKIVWSCAMPISAEVLRACARHAGCTVWCEEGDVVYASDTIASIHSVKSGHRTLQLPRACRVEDAVTGELIGYGIDRIEMEISAPETRIFTLD